MLVDQFQRPISSAKKPASKPLAVAPYLESERDYVTSGISPARMAAIFKEADSGDIGRQAALFEQIEERDGHLLGEKGKRVNSIADVTFELAPASDDAQDIKIYEFCNEWYQENNELVDHRVSMQDAVGKGFACLEQFWPKSGPIVPYQINFMEQKRFTFMDHTGILRKYPLLITDNNPMGVEIPEWQLIFHQYNGQTGHPTRSGIYRVCAWMWMYKNYSMKDWITFMEIYGMPLRLGKYVPGANDEDKAVLKAAITGMGTNASGIISKATEIEFIKATQGSTDSNVYKDLTHLSNQEMSKALIGSAQSSDTDSPGSFAADKEKNIVRYDLIKADSRAVAGTIRAQTFRPIVLFNFGIDAKVPLYGAVWKEKEDLKAKAETYEILNRIIPLSKKNLYEEFATPEPEDEEDSTKQPEAPDAPEPGKPKIEEKTTKITAKINPGQTDRLGDSVDPLMQVAIDRIKTFMMKAKDLNEIRDNVYNLFPEMEAEDIGVLFTEAMLSNELQGRYEA